METPILRTFRLGAELRAQAHPQVFRAMPFLLLLPGITAAQEPVKIRTETNAVQVDVAVRDSKGKPVPDLTRNNFKIRDEGKPRPIEIFSFNRNFAGAAAPTPPDAMASARALPGNVFSNRNAEPSPIASHTTVILLDGMNGWFENFSWSQKAVVGLLDKAPPDERIAVYAVTRYQGLVVVQNYTSDRQMLLKAVADYTTTGLCPAPPGMEDMAASMMDRPSRPANACPADAAAAVGHTGGDEARVQVYMRSTASEGVRMAFQALAARLGSVPGRKSVFWLTQGFPPAEMRAMEQAWDKTFTALNEANVEVNTVDSNRLGGPPRLWGAGAILTMQQVAERTGGQAYYHRNDLDDAIAEGIAAARESYTLGFYLAEAERDRKYHRLAVSTDLPHLELQYRQGYYAGADLKPDRKIELESVILSTADLSSIGITTDLSVESGQPRAALKVRLSPDLATLTVKQVGDVCTGKIEVMFVEFAAGGKQLAKVSDRREFRFAASTRAEREHQGLVMTQTLQLMDGASRLLVIVRDSASGRIGSLTVPLDRLAR
jgi:VWFA-related protein